MTITTRVSFDDGDALSEEVLRDGKLIGSIWFDPDEPRFSVNDGTWFSRRMLDDEPYWAPNAQQHQTREEALAVFAS